MEVHVRTPQALKRAVKEKAKTVVVDDPALSKRLLRVLTVLSAAPFSRKTVLPLTRLGRTAYTLGGSAAGGAILSSLLVVAIAAMVTIGVLVIVALYRDYDVELRGPVGAQRLTLTRRKDAFEAS